MTNLLSASPNLRIVTFNTQALLFLTDSNVATIVPRILVENLLSLLIEPLKGATNENPLWLNKLVELGFIAYEAQNQYQNSRNLNLRKFNWRSATDYLNITHNYPFLEYDKGGFNQDRNRMDEYLSAEPEQPRFKSYAEDRIKHQGRNPCVSADIIASGGTDSCIENIISALSFSLGVTKEVYLSTGGSLVKKTVPSGGGRHPIEAYLVDVSQQLVYHFNSKDYTLTTILRKEKNELYGAFFGTQCNYLAFEVKFAVVLTCIWERNMYRYREPRTFRSVHLDAGHASMQIETCLLKMGYRNQAQYNMEAMTFEKLVELDPLIEGVMSAVMIGDQIHEL